VALASCSTVSILDLNLLKLKLENWFLVFEIFKFQF
jgi:hypothetical protein